MLKDFFLGATTAFKNRQRIKKSKEVLVKAKKIQRKEEEEVYVRFLIDSYNDAYSKAVGANVKFLRNVTKKAPCYLIFSSFYKELLKEKINPLVFFTFAFEQRQKKGIPATLKNICTQNTINHFLKFRARNMYRVSTYSNNQNYKQEIGSRLAIDIRSLGTLLLRKEITGLSENETGYFSSYFQAVYLGNTLKTEDQVAAKFCENIQFDKSFKEDIEIVWNNLLEEEKNRFKKLVNTHTQEVLKKRIERILIFLDTIKH